MARPFLPPFFPQLERSPFRHSSTASLLQLPLTADVAVSVADKSAVFAAAYAAAVTRKLHLSPMTQLPLSPHGRIEVAFF
jgi:hypothetical protein